MKGVRFFAVLVVAGMLVLSGAMGLCVAQDEEEEAGFDALILIHQVNKENTIHEGNTSHTAEIVNSGHGMKGITQINQAPGNINNQANVVAVALNTRPDEGAIQVGVCVEYDNNEIVSTGPRETLIDNSFNQGAAGIVQINQAAGSQNNQFNLVAVVVGDSYALPDPQPPVPAGFEGMISLSESELGNVSGAAVDAEGESSQGVKGVNGINNSFKGFHGIVQVNQTEGNQNTIIMQTLVSVEMISLK